MHLRWLSLNCAGAPGGSGKLSQMSVFCLLSFISLSRILTSAISWSLQTKLPLIITSITVLLVISRFSCGSALVHPNTCMEESLLLVLHHVAFSADVRDEQEPGSVTQKLLELFRQYFYLLPCLDCMICNKLTMILPLLVSPLILSHKISANLLFVLLSFIHLSCSLMRKTAPFPHLPCLPFPSNLCPSIHNSILVVQAVSPYFR